MFTFKTQRVTGRLSRAAGERPQTHIKLKRRVVGRIYWDRGQGAWKVGLMLVKAPTEANPAPFRWVFFKQRFSAEDYARVWVLAHEDSFIKLNLHQLEA